MHLSAHKIWFCGFIVLLACWSVPPSRAQNLNTLLMQSTFEIQGVVEGGGVSTGTVFIVGKPMKADPTKAFYVLVTAAHVLDGVSGDFAYLTLRHREPDGSYKTGPYQLRIRNGGSALYLKHPEADVAVMFIGLPSEAEVSLLPTSILADDDRLKALEIQPGDELLCLGFPLAIEFNSFPVIRSGLLASYPVTPSKRLKTFYYNFHVFPGNSGGPVYFNFLNRAYAGAIHVGIQQGIMGLVSQQVTTNQPGYESAQLDIAKIIPSTFIIEAIALLPDAPTASASNVNFKTNNPAILPPIH